jgi:hypothetical protein
MGMSIRPVAQDESSGERFVRRGEITDTQDIGDWSTDAFKEFAKEEDGFIRYREQYRISLDKWGGVGSALISSWTGVGTIILNQMKDNKIFAQMPQGLP